MALSQYGSPYDCRGRYHNAHILNQVPTEQDPRVREEDELKQLWREANIDKEPESPAEVPAWALWVKENVLQRIEDGVIAAGNLPADIKEWAMDAERAYDEAQNRKATRQAAPASTPSGNEREGANGRAENFDPLSQVFRGLGFNYVFLVYMFMAQFVGGARAAHVDPFPQDVLPGQHLNSFFDFVLCLTVRPALYLLVLVLSGPLAIPGAIWTNIFPPLLTVLWTISRGVFVFVHTNPFVILVQRYLTFGAVLCFTAWLIAPYIIFIARVILALLVNIFTYVAIVLLKILGLTLGVPVVWEAARAAPVLIREVCCDSWQEICGRFSLLWNCSLAHFVARLLRSQWTWVLVLMIAVSKMGILGIDEVSVVRHLISNGDEAKVITTSIQ